MATYSISISFTVESKDLAKAEKHAGRIGDLVISESLAEDFSVVDIEELENDEDDFDGPTYFDEDDDE